MLIKICKLIDFVFFMASTVIQKYGIFFHAEAMPVTGCLICCAICQHKKLLLRKNIKKNGRKAIDRHMAILIYVDSPENQVYRQVNGPPGILSL
ncbi:hypothetical protein Tresu_1603 [Treponema succinifaciens DSM 2489]|uniref:Uncharacterized protein n=1 Tax=Treponema succinifaciens (strain ATCC 33096 / DSM 2489 / 6091) TaxID=869209 RepID=F2NVR6_TRES6|nr:hypothetical protein Tresu_1603 [Treponema succinifaciens DSM 2489]